MYTINMDTSLNTPLESQWLILLVTSAVPINGLSCFMYT